VQEYERAFRIFDSLADHPLCEGDCLAWASNMVNDFGWDDGAVLDALVDTGHFDDGVPEGF